jgi:hypothetical protein
MLTLSTSEVKILKFILKRDGVVSNKTVFDELCFKNDNSYYKWFVPVSIRLRTRGLVKSFATTDDERTILKESKIYGESYFLINSNVMLELMLRLKDEEDEW